MSASCCSNGDQSPHGGPRDAAYRRVLWIALAINAAMFVVEIGAGWAASSVALHADALDFLGDAGNYAISLFALGMTLRFRAGAALVKGATMALFGLWVIGSTMWHAVHGTLPDVGTMSVVGAVALAANGAVFALLWAYRSGDSNMRSVWLCTRNDVIGNVAVLVAALGVFGTGTGWPDLIVATIMAVLALQAAWLITRQALPEWRAGHVSPADRRPVEVRIPTSR